MYVCICENLDPNLPKSNLKVPFHECKESGVTCSYLEMLPLENCVSPSSPISPITNHHEFDGSKTQESGPLNLEGKSLTRCQQEHTFFQMFQERLLPCLFWFLVALCGPLLVTAYLQPPPPLRRLHKDFLVRKQMLLTCVSLKRTLVTGLRPHQENPV